MVSGFGGPMSRLFLPWAFLCQAAVQANAPNPKMLMRIYKSMPATMPGYKKAGFTALLLLSLALSACTRTSDWRSATRESANIAPTPEEFDGAVVMAFRAKVWGVRGIFADHTWLATKPEGGEDYTVYEVIGWRKYRNMPSLRIEQDVPDRHWFGAKPITLVDMRGEQAEAIIDKVDEVARRYPYADQYRAFPGPNSNTFTAWMAREVPELGLELPLRAVGKSFPLESATP